MRDVLNALFSMVYVPKESIDYSKNNTCLGFSDLSFLNIITLHAQERAH